ncbi:histidine kinase [Paenibacillus albidus]|uniref:cache domain-containing sensor histidine kinase n=1 Tax=Paenibacillus albidus TaxID=2041023 RepID=UPI001BE61D9F|nr:sensor histidine kinase [Paenibacillus albidus]MBT2288422.1 histidine kinase [Paenibacillus albidus]
MFGQGRRSGSLFMKFSISFILVGLIPLFALSFFSVRIFTGYIERYTTSNLQQMVLYMSYNLNATFNQYNEISKIMYTGKYEGFFESSSQNQTVNVNELEQINNIPINSFLKTLLQSDPYITSAFFVRKSDQEIYEQEKENKSILAEAWPYKDWIHSMAPQPSKVAIFPSHPDNYYFGSDRKVYTIGRNLIDTSQGVSRTPKVVGTLFLDVDITLFQQFLQELNLGDKDELYLLDGEGHVFFSNLADRVEQTYEVEELVRSNKNMIILSEDIPFLDGHLIARIHRSSLFDKLLAARTTIYIAILICSAVLIVMGFWFSRRLAAPIRRVIKQMAVVESGKLDTQLPIESNDEMGRLAYGFNRMVERLQDYINEAYVAQIKQKQTELNALKSQIRPHYLYNTLEVIRMNAVDKEASEVADMIFSLSNQLKYVIDYGEDRVSIRSELEHLKDYFYIISVRYDNYYELHLDISPEIDLDWPILKLSLQPMVENAVSHGLRQKGKGTVGVTIEKRDSEYAVTVYDDGDGMNPERLKEVLELLEETGLPGKSVGLKNVHERIRTVFGEVYGLSVSSREHIGTSVTLTFPAPGSIERSS